MARKTPTSTQKNGGKMYAEKVAPNPVKPRNSDKARKGRA